MPIKSIASKDQLDRFYTKPEIAQKCASQIRTEIELCDLIVEPSAGTGSFLEALRPFGIATLGYDIDPQHPDVIRGDWFDVQIDPRYHRVGIIGNPPFGQRNKTSIAFIKHAQQFVNVSLIAMVLPSVWGKYTFHKHFPIEKWSLTHEYTLPVNSFIYLNQEYHIPAIFQCWVNRKDIPDLRKGPRLITKDFKFVSADQADFFILGAAPSRVIHPMQVKSTQRGYYIKSNINLNQLIDRFQWGDWARYGKSSVNGGVFWMTKTEIIEAYETEFIRKL